MSYCIYLRKSRIDKDYEESGDTLLRHEKMLREFAVKNKMTVTKIYREIVSGESISNRPALQELLHDVEKDCWDGVIVADIERLARGDTCDQGIIINTFKFTNTKIITPNKIYNATDEFDEGFFEFSLFMSRQEYKVIKRRLQRGKYASVKEGKFVSSTPPYGYDRVKLRGEKGYTLEENHEESRIVQRIFESFSEKSKHTTNTTQILKQIKNELDLSNVTTRNGASWSINSLREILKNPVYIGKIRWNSRPRITKIANGKKVTVRPRNKEYEIYDGLHSAIVNEALFYEVQKHL